MKLKAQKSHNNQINAPKGAQNRGSKMKVLMVENKIIKKLVSNIASDGCGIVIQNNAGFGCAYPEDIQNMLEAGDFDDAKIVDLDMDLMADAFASNDIFLDYETDWMQIQLGFGDTQDTLITAWIW